MDMEEYCQDIKKKLEEIKEVKEMEGSKRPLQMLMLTVVVTIILIAMAIGLPAHFIAKEKTDLGTLSPSNMTTRSTSPSVPMLHHISTTTAISVSQRLTALLNCTGDEDLLEPQIPTDDLLEEFIQTNRRNLVADNYQMNCRYYFYLSNHVKKQYDVSYLTADAKCRSKKAVIVRFHSRFEVCRIVRKILTMEREQKANQRLLPHDLIDFPQSLWIDQEVSSDDASDQVRNDLLCPGETVELLSRGYYAALDFSQTHACLKVVPRNSNRQFICKRCFK